MLGTGSGVHVRPFGRREGLLFGAPAAGSLRSLGADLAVDGSMAWSRSESSVGVCCGVERRVPPWKVEEASAGQQAEAPLACRDTLWELWGLKTEREGGLKNSDWSRVRVWAAFPPCSATVRGLAW